MWLLYEYRAHLFSEGFATALHRLIMQSPGKQPQAVGQLLKVPIECYPRTTFPLVHQVPAFGTNYSAVSRTE